MIKRLDPTKLAVLSVLIAGLLFIAVNIISNVWFGSIRADLTAGKAFTTSSALRPVFANISEPIVVRLYYTDSVGALSPRHGAYYTRVRDLLQQFGTLSGGKIKLELYSPEPFSDVEDRAVGFGLQSLPLSQQGEVGYFGLAATNSTDDTEVIPFFNLERERFLEYDLAKLIYTLARPTRPRVGYISALPIDGAESLSQEQMQQLQVAGAPLPQPWAFMSQIREFFTIVKLEANLTEVPANIDTLMLIQAENLTPQAQFAIDQFVLKGGKILAFVDPVAESMGLMIGQQQPGQRRRPGSLEGMQKLLNGWGAKVVEAKVVGDLDSAIRVNLGVDGRPMLSDYVAWMHLDGRNFDPNDAITGDLKQINVATSGAIEAVAGAGTTVTPLMMTGPRSQRLDADKFEGVPNIVGLFRDFVPQNKREVLAARISGKASVLQARTWASMASASSTSAGAEG